jgi:ribosomal protein S18 acetylase RimI-like enzyme
MPQDYLDRMDVAQRAQTWRWRLEGLEAVYPTRVLEDGTDGVVGFAITGPSDDADADPEVVGAVLSLYLLPSHWGRAGGRALLRDAVQRLRSLGRQRATLWVLETNARARGFYEAQGWAADGRRKTETGFGFPIEEVRYGRQL